MQLYSVEDLLPSNPPNPKLKCVVESYPHLGAKLLGGVIKPMNYMDQFIFEPAQIGADFISLFSVKGREFQPRWAKVYTFEGKTQNRLAACLNNVKGEVMNVLLDVDTYRELMDVNVHWQP